MKTAKLPKGISIRTGSYIAYLTWQGKPIRQAVGKVGCITRKQAAGKRLELETQIENGTFKPKSSRPKPVEPVKPVSYTVAELWQSYRLDYLSRSGRDVERLDIAWKRLQATFEKISTADVETNDISAYSLARQTAGMQNATVNRELALLKAMFRHGTRLTPPMVDRIPSFPRRLKESRPRQGFIGDKEYAVLCRNAKPLWLRTLLAICYTFGFRKSEALNLRCKHVDPFERWLMLEETKNGKPRKVKMTKEVYDLVLAAMVGKGPEGYLLTRQDGSPVVDPRDDWYALCVTSGLGRFEPAKRNNGKDYDRYVGLQLHDFRRSAIREMLRRGINEDTCMKISGHTTRSVFSRYNIVDTTDLEQASMLIERGRNTQVSVSETAAKTDTKTDTSVFAGSPVSRNSLI